MDLVLISSCAANFRCAQKGYKLKQGELWRHSVSSAIIAKQIAGIKNNEEKHLIFTCALIKDIGKVILSQYVEKAYEKISILVNKFGKTFQEAEKAIIGIDHAELGALVARAWHFPDRMAEIIKYHHTPFNSENCKYDASIVCVADAIYLMIREEIQSDWVSILNQNEMIDLLQMDDKEIENIVGMFVEQLNRVEALLHTG